MVNAFGPFCDIHDGKFSNDNEQGDIERREENYISRGKVVEGWEKAVTETKKFLEK